MSVLVLSRYAKLSDLRTVHEYFISLVILFSHAEIFFLEFNSFLFQGEGVCIFLTGTSQLL